MANFRINDGVVLDYTSDGWTEFKKWLDGTYARLPYAWVDEGVAYNIVASDGKFYRTFSINKSDATEFEASYKLYRPLVTPAWESPYKICRFGNLTASSTNEVLVCARGYVEPASQAQRSVVSTSVQDKSGGSGAFAVRLAFLNSAYEYKTEDIVLNGTTPVNMVATDLRFVEEMKVIQGSEAVGAIKLMSATAGGGTEITGINAQTDNAFLCHHYVPAGKRAYILNWQVSIDDECSFKLKGQARYGANLVYENWDLRRIFQSNPTPPLTMEGFWDMQQYPVGEKCYVRVVVTPNQNTSTVIRAHLHLWEE